MRKLALTDAALRNLDEIFEYLAEQVGDPTRARRFIDQIAGQCEKLASLPSVLGRPRDELSPGLRSFPFRGYVIFMRYSEDKLEIVNILHARPDIDALFEDGEPDR